MGKYGVLGKKLGHSFSPEIHSKLGDYEYTIIEKNEDELDSFFMNGDFDGVNVTIPYKKTVMKYLSSISELASRVGSVNTIVRKEDNSFYGDNTDVYGFMALVKFSKIDVSGKKTLVLGSGGASVAVIEALKEMGAIPVTISRSGEFNYDNLELNSDAKVIVNTTPVGMYPQNGEAPLDLTSFDSLEGVIDIIYNPYRTQLLLQAEELNIPCADGLYMLVAQAKRAAELFTGKEIDDSKIDEIYYNLSSKMKNVVLVGMPGSGKSTIAKELSKLTGRSVVDSDKEFERIFNITPAQAIEKKGEPEFRNMETEVVKELGKASGTIIATGGGVVLRDENIKALHQNGVIIWLKRDITSLPKDGRPLSLKGNLSEMYEIRKPFYKKASDYEVDNIDIHETVRIISEMI